MNHDFAVVPPVPQTDAGEPSSAPLSGAEKKMRKAVHLAQSPEPIIEGESVKTLCGKIIFDAVSVSFTGGDFRIEMVDIEKLSGVCWGCKKAEKVTGRYIYGVRSREEIRQENRSSETENL